MTDWLLCIDRSTDSFPPLPARNTGRDTTESSFESFLPNPVSFFAGFSDELSALQINLLSEDDNTVRAVMLSGPPGSGKTYIARKFVTTNIQTFEGGIYWFDARSEEKVMQRFVEIARKVNPTGFSSTRANHAEEGAAAVTWVTEWLASRDKYLLVFDGLTCHDRDAVQLFRRFLPAYKGRTMSVLYTAVDRNLAAEEDLLAPEIIRVGRLSMSDACLIVYKALDIRMPSKKEQQKAKELVDYHEHLPRALKGAAQMLSIKQKPLERYKSSSYTASALLTEPYTDIMNALGTSSEFAALDLIKLLAFFDASVPIALINMGRQALHDFSIEIRSVRFGGDGKKHLDDTLATLIQFGLAERITEQYDVPFHSSSASSFSGLSKKRSQGSRPDGSHDTSSTKSSTRAVEKIRVLLVVQRFVRDKLRAEGQQSYDLWLLAAIELFCQSFRLASEKSGAPINSLLVEADYLEYQKQASRLYLRLPKTMDETSENLKIARQDLRAVRRKVREELDLLLPTASFTTHRIRLSTSVFEQASSSSSNGPADNSSSLSLDRSFSGEEPVDSPISFHSTLADLPGQRSRAVSMRGRPFDIHSAFGGSRHSSAATSRMPSDSEATERPKPSPLLLPAGMPPSPLLREVYAAQQPGRARTKDLGEFRPVSYDQQRSNGETRGTPGNFSKVPVLPLSTAGLAQPTNLRNAHSVNTSSSSSPEHVRSKSTSDLPPVNHRAALAEKATNTALSPFAPEFRPQQIQPVGLDIYDGLPIRPFQSSASSSRHQSRLPAGTGVPMNAIFEDVKFHTEPPSPEVSRQENWTTAISSTPPINVPYPTFPTMFTNMPDPTGYTSQPMSLENSHESHLSRATAPPATLGRSLGLSPSPRSRSRIPVLATRTNRPQPLAIDTVDTTDEILNAGNWADSEFEDTEPVPSLSPSTQRRLPLSAPPTRTLAPRTPPRSPRTPPRLKPVVVPQPYSMRHRQGQMRFGEASPIDLGEAAKRAEIEIAKRSRARRKEGSAEGSRSPSLSPSVEQPW